MLVLLVLGIAVVARDTAFVRARIRALVKLPIDWKYTQLSLTHGVVLRGFSIESPPPFDAVAPELLHVDRIQVSWSLGKLLRRGPMAERLKISGVRATVVVDEAGHSSLAVLGGETPVGSGPAVAPSPPTPSSHLLEALAARLPLDRATISDAHLRLIHVQAAGPQHAADTELDAELFLPAPNELRIQVRTALISQNLIDELPPIHDMLSLEAHASFRPSEARVLIEVSKLRGLDGALDGSARIEVWDVGAPLIDRAHLVFDSKPIQASLSHTRSPLQLRGKLSLDLARVRASAFPVVEPEGFVDADAKLEQLLVRRGALHIEGARLAVDLKLRAPPRHLAPLPNAPVGAATVALKAGAFALTSGGFSLELGGVALDTKIDGLDPYAASPMRLASRVRSTGRVARFTVRPATLTVSGEDLRIDSDLRLPRVQAGALLLDAPIGKLSATLGAHVLVRDQPARMHIDLEGVRFDPARLMASEGKEHSELRIGPFSIRSQLDKRADDAVAYDLEVRAPDLDPLGSFISLPSGVSVPWSEIATRLHTHGRISGLASVSTLRVEHKTELELGRPSLRGGPLPMAARRIALVCSSRGGQIKHAAELDLSTEGLVLLDEVLGSQRLTGKLSFDRARPAGAVELALTGGAGPKGELRASLDFDRRAHALRYELHLALDKLALVAHLVPRALSARHELDWSKLAVELDGRGSVRDAIRELVGWHLMSDPLESARGDAALKLTLRQLVYRDRLEPRAMTSETLSVAVEAHAAAGDAQDPRPSRSATIGLDIDRATATFDDHKLALEALSPKLAITARGPARTPELSGTLALALGKLAQDFYAPYPIGGVDLGLAFRANTKGLLRVERLNLVNKAGGSALALKGGFDLTNPGRRDLSVEELLGDQPSLGAAEDPRRLPGRVGLDVELSITQALGAFPIANGVVAAGTLKLPVRVQSADLALFAVRGAIDLAGVKLRLDQGFEADGVQGHIPIVAELSLEKRRDADGRPRSRLRIVPHPVPISFPQPRFAEHQPFLAERSFFSMDKLKIRGLELGPLAGNLAIDHTRLELAQLELRASQGRIRGQLLADLAGADTRIAFRGNVTGLMPPRARGKDDRLDANTMLVIDPARLAIEGRAELVHISKALFLDLLDAWDPYHAVVNANRARRALRFGYPDQVRLGFAQGFASLRLTLGGLTRAVRIDEIKGMPVGPLLERYLGKAMRPLLQQEPTAVDVTTTAESSL